MYYKMKHMGPLIGKKKTLGIYSDFWRPANWLLNRDFSHFSKLALILANSSIKFIIQKSIINFFLFKIVRRLLDSKFNMS
jgi:hypothetical protein